MLVTDDPPPNLLSSPTALPSLLPGACSTGSLAKVVAMTTVTNNSDAGEDFNPRAAGPIPLHT